MEPLIIGRLSLGKSSLDFPEAELSEERHTNKASAMSVPWCPAPIEPEGTVGLLLRGK